MEKNKKGSFPSHIPDQELEETVDDKSLKHGAIDQLKPIAEPDSWVRTSYMSRITSITNAASKENNAIREAIAYIGTINMIRMTILLQARRVSRRKGDHGSLGDITYRWRCGFR